LIDDTGVFYGNEESIHLTGDSLLNYCYNRAKEITPVTKVDKLSYVPNGSSCDDIFTSKDWMGHYIINHVDVDYTKREGLFQPSSGHQNQPFSNNLRNSGVDGTNDWLYEYNQAISGQEPISGSDSENDSTTDDILSLFENEENSIIPTADEDVTGFSKQDVDGDITRNITAAANNNVTSLLVIPTESDVLMGRGGKSNNHIGNQRYLKEVERMKSFYRNACKNDKTDWAQRLVNRVHSYGGRFVKYSTEDSVWYEVSNKVARKKAGQAMRENNTAFARLQKRKKYNKKPKKEQRIGNVSN